MVDLLQRPPRWHGREQNRFYPSCSAIQPDGRVLQNEYDPQRRVTNQWATVGPDLRLVRTATFLYTNNYDPTNLTLTLTGTTTLLITPTGDDVVTPTASCGACPIR